MLMVFFSELNSAEAEWSEGSEPEEEGKIYDKETENWTKRNEASAS